MNWIRTALILLAGGVLAACSTLAHPGSPKPAFDLQGDIRQLEAKFGKPDAITEYYSQPETRQRRDEFVTGRLLLINLRYLEFIRDFAADTAQINSALDILKIGVDLAITVVGGASTKAALGAASAGLTGSRLSIEKNFFQEKTVPVLIGEMNAQRKEALIAILEGLRKDVDDYRLAQALVDLHAYQEAGTFVGALQSIQKDSGRKEAQASDRIELLRSSVFGEDEASRRIIAFLWKDGKRTDPQGNALQPIPERMAAVRAWMERNGLGDLSVQKFLDNPVLGPTRIRAIKEIPISPAQ